MSKAQESIGILGVGFSVPDRIRKNGDPIFDWVLEASPPGHPLFVGYDERRILGPGEDVTQLMMKAVQAAMANAHCLPDDIGMVLGYVSVSDYLDPNGLGLIHRELGLPKGTPIIPLNNEFNNFTMAITIAQALMRGGMGGNALIACAGNWSRHVDYHTPQSLSAGDGAGALILGPLDGKGAWTLVDSATGVWSGNFGAMFMAGAPVSRDYDCATNPHHCTFTSPYFQISEAGREEYRKFGVEGVPDVVNELLRKHSISGEEIALVTHQSSSVLIEAWTKAIQPGAYLETLATYGNMTVANLAVNLAAGLEGVEQPHLVIAGIGVEGQVNAVLFSRLDR